MKNLEDALLKIKENPKKYIGIASLNRLNLFILGYMQSQLDEDGTYSEWLGKFQEFVQKKYNVYYSFRFSDIIRYFSTSDEHAFAKFYELLIEFSTWNRLGGFYELYEGNTERGESETWYVFK